ncbi:hypothetical protein V3C99_012973 [Haemonchus contortus]
MHGQRCLHRWRQVKRRRKGETGRKTCGQKSVEKGHRRDRNQGQTGQRTKRARRQTGRWTATDKQTGTDSHRTQTDRKTGKHGHIKTNGDRHTDGQIPRQEDRDGQHTGGHAQTDTDRQRDVDGQTHKEKDRHVQRGRRGQTRTDTHQDVACKDEDNKYTDRRDKNKKAAWLTSILSTPIKRPWTTIAHVDLKRNELRGGQLRNHETV